MDEDAIEKNDIGKDFQRDEAIRWMFRVKLQLSHNRATEHHPRLETLLQRDRTKGPSHYIIYEEKTLIAGIAQLGEQQTEAWMPSGGPVFNPRSWHCFLSPNSASSTTSSLFLRVHSIYYEGDLDIGDRNMCHHRVAF